MVHDAAGLRKQGYHQIPPSQATADIDRPIVESLTCPNCGENHPLQYRPYYRPQPYSYLALGICPACGYETEI